MSVKKYIYIYYRVVLPPGPSSMLQGSGLLLTRMKNNPIDIADIDWFIDWQCKHLGPNSRSCALRTKHNKSQNISQEQDSSAYQENVIISQSIHVPWIVLSRVDGLSFRSKPDLPRRQRGLYNYKAFNFCNICRQIQSSQFQAWNETIPIITTKHTQYYRKHFLVVWSFFSKILRMEAFWL